MVLPVIDKKKTGYRLYYYMKLNGLTPRDIQNYLSLSCVQTVYRWLDGTNIPAVDNLYALSQLFRTQVDDMIVGSRNLEKRQMQRRQARRLRVYGKQLSEIPAAS